jgi:hypothetical protein
MIAIRIMMDIGCLLFGTNRTARFIAATLGRVVFIPFTAVVNGFSACQNFGAATRETHSKAAFGLGKQGTDVDWARQATQSEFLYLGAFL